MIHLNDDVMNIIYGMKHNLEYKHVMDELKNIFDIDIIDLVKFSYIDARINVNCLYGICNGFYELDENEEKNNNVCPNCGENYGNKEPNIKEIVEEYHRLINFEKEMEIFDRETKELKDMQQEDKIIYQNGPLKKKKKIIRKKIPTHYT